MKSASTDTPAYEIRYITEEEAAMKAAARKAALGFFYLEEIESFAFPTYFTAAFYYEATGEGHDWHHDGSCS